MSEEKTEQPTAQKRKKNRKEGQVPRSKDLGSWTSLFVVLLIAPLLLGRELTALREIMVRSFTIDGRADVADARGLMADGLQHVFIAIGLLGSIVLVVGVAAALSQGGFFLATKTVQPKLSKLSPIKGLKRMFGMNALWEGLKMLVKASVVTVLVYFAVQRLMPLLGGMVPIQVMIETVSHDALSLMRTVSVAGILMAAVDYIFQRKRMGKQTRMTKHEVKQENKQSEGDPMLKGAIRSRQLAASRNRMMSDVPQADVVLVNPTHVAVALRYDAEKGAPRVVARGAGVIAQKIRETATEARVPLVSDVPLARALYRSTTVGQEIPAELFAAVAQVMAFVISRRNQGQGGGQHRSPRAEEDLPEVARGGRRRKPSASPSPGR